MNEFFKNNYSFRGIDNNIYQTTPFIKRQTISVPAGIRYLSENDWFRLSNYPAKCIINKQIPGCGFTEYCLNGPEPVILCSPRKLLLQNKKDQHGDDVFLVKNEMEKDLSVDIDFNSKRSSKAIKDAITRNDQICNESYLKNREVYAKIYKEFHQYKEHMAFKSEYVGRKLPLKILVTYDSFHLIKDILFKDLIFPEFYVIIDEFQSILHDARFKSNTELGFLDSLSDSLVKRIMFVSATPMLDEYIQELDEFKYLPYFTLNWAAEDPTRIIKPDLNVQYMSSINAKSKEIINSYLSGNFESVVVMRNGQPTQIISTEAVFYVNSVNQILTIISNNGLKPDQVNILCADTEENRKKIRAKLGKDFELGSIPLKGEPNKMFTFCTRTVYLGADFYSKCARSFIFSDANSDCLSVDISEDLPQILGRQRDLDNPWKNSANFYYKTTVDYRKMTKEDFNNIITSKMKATENLMSAYNKCTDLEKEDLAIKYQKDAKGSNYRDDYIAVNTIIEGNGLDQERKRSLKPVINNLVRINEKRAFNIQQIDYADRFSVFSKVNEKFAIENNYTLNQEVEGFFKIYDGFTTMYDKLKYLCNCTFSKEIIDCILSQISDSDEIKSYYLSIGPSRLKELGFSITRIRKELGIVLFSPEVLINTIYSNFHVEDKLSLLEIKSRLSDLYSTISYNKTPKATDLEEFFEVKECKVLVIDENGNKKRSRGYELVKSYELEMRIKLEQMEKRNK